ncbi:hypothetical protein AVEN_80404-1 [Araneus ventricosus]|uniref:Uncharacterized protein n=1 Tax=Araneus ventricosus TaxID=182803 RepID=A0A4Y2LMY6_ARAVE|nr:hypothetical protein AVEN_80404-1 [Araneus ventricosus]
MTTHFSAKKAGHRSNRLYKESYRKSSVLSGGRREELPPVVSLWLWARGVNRCASAADFQFPPPHLHPPPLAEGTPHRMTEIITSPYRRRRPAHNPLHHFRWPVFQIKI